MTPGTTDRRAACHPWQSPRMQRSDRSGCSGSEDGSLTIQTKVAGTLADRVVVAQGVQIGTPTGTDKGVGTLNLDNDLYKDGVNITTPAAVASFSAGSAVYLPTNVGRGSATAFSVSTNIAAAWESVGKTGSGATNIWAALDSVPATATAIIVSADFNTGTGGHVLYCRKNGDATAAGAITNVSAWLISGLVANSLAIVPISSAGIFDAYCSLSGGAAIDLYLVGWVDSLI